MIKKTVIYPFSHASNCLPRYYQMLSGYQITSVVVPGKLPQGELDASFYDEGETMGIPINYDLAMQLTNCDTLIWSEFDYTDIPGFRNQVFNHISNALRRGTSVICTQPLNCSELKKFETEAIQSDSSFRYLDYEACPDEIFDTAILKKIKVPVISVYGTIENCSKFETQLALRKRFLDEGYRVTQIGSRHYSSLFGFHSFPHFMFETGYSETQKILGFNRWLNKLSDEEKPDVIILGVPGGLLPVNDRFPFHFGIIAYLVSCAIETDCTILNLPCEEINTAYIKRMQNLFRYRFGTQLDCIAMSNVRMNQDSVSSEYQALEYDVLPHRLLSSLVAKCSQELVPVFGVVDGDQLFQYICSYLSGNNERVV